MNHSNFKNDQRPILGSAVGGLRFELVLNKPPENGSFEDLEVPFATLSTTGCFSKVLLARIAMGEDKTVRYFALKIQQSDYSSRLFGTFFSNPKILKLWEIERNNLSIFVEMDNEIVELFDFGDVISQEKKQKIFQSKPISFCKRKQVYFYPICPNCTGFLCDCRDDPLLAENGLPTFTNSTIRYLYCPECVKKSKRNVFYSYSLTSEELPGTRAIIRRRTELYRDFMQIIQNKAEYTKNTNQDYYLNEIFPCFSCSNQKDCYSPDNKNAKRILAESLLVPVSYYECVLLPLEMLHIHYDDFSDLLGGASWSEFQRSQISKGMTFAQQLIINQIEPFFTSPYQFFFRDHPQGLFAYEILRLKLIAFTQLCRGIMAIHKKCGQPHLDIKPGSVMVKLSIAGRDLPSRWNFGIKLIDLGATLPFDQYESGHEVSNRIFYPPHNFQKIYTSPIIHGSQFGLEEKIDLKITSVKSIKELQNTVHAQIEAYLLSREIKADDFCEHDLIRINLNAPAKGLENVVIWASKKGQEDRNFKILSKTVALKRSSYSIMEKNTGVTFYDTNVAFFRTYHVPCDVYSLGIMLLRSLLLNDEQDLRQVLDIIQSMIIPIQNRQANLDKNVEIEIRSLLKNKSDVLSPYSLFYRKEDREQQTNAIANDLWDHILIFALKLMTNIKGFSFCEHHGDYNPDKPESKMQEILLALEEINSRVHAKLFGSVEENKEILEVFDEMLQILNSDALLK